MKLLELASFHYEGMTIHGDEDTVHKFIADHEELDGIVEELTQENLNLCRTISALTRQNNMKAEAMASLSSHNKKQEDTIAVLTQQNTTQANTIAGYMADVSTMEELTSNQARFAQRQERKIENLERLIRNSNIATTEEFK